MPGIARKGLISGWFPVQFYTRILVVELKGNASVISIPSFLGEPNTSLGPLVTTKAVTGVTIVQGFLCILFFQSGITSFLGSSIFALLRL